MSTTRLALGFMIVFIIGCTEEIMVPAENELPEKLYPYETVYDATTFQDRRDELVNTVPDDALIVVATNDLYLRSGEEDENFRPAPNFYYLTGFDEPNAVAVLRKSPSDANASEMIMFVEYREGGEILWLGPVYGPEGAVEYFGADSAYEIERFGPLVASYLASGAYGSFYSNLDMNPTVADSFYSHVISPPELSGIDDIVEDMRVIKSALEINTIQKAVDVSVQAFTESMMTIKPGIYEYEVEAIFDLVTRLNGCPRTAFPTAVASGPNINTLHYGANDRLMEDGDLVMIDFGAEYGYYASDITRTFPANGTFSSEQATVYQIVLDAYLAVIDMAAPGVNYNDLSFLSLDTIIDGLLREGIISGDKSEIFSSYQYRRYIPAGLAHGVGLYVHDPNPGGAYYGWTLEENMVLALEPHVYLIEGDQTVHEDYWGVSARIEDEILITADGCEVLSVDLPVEIDEIEALMK